MSTIRLSGVEKNDRSKKLEAVLTTELRLDTDLSHVPVLGPVAAPPTPMPTPMPVVCLARPGSAGSTDCCGGGSGGDEAGGWRWSR
ncbi:hypothetical protein GQ54DRAFT_57768 [Martensiomyces pterosporus]|nr:hypothetical protein GQ54DRAFT_57768 [Martensiomyces pterosporus]